MLNMAGSPQHMRGFNDRLPHHHEFFSVPRDSENKTRTNMNTTVLNTSPGSLTIFSESMNSTTTLNYLLTRTFHQHLHCRSPLMKCPPAKRLLSQRRYQESLFAVFDKNRVETRHSPFHLVDALDPSSHLKIPKPSICVMSQSRPPRPPAAKRPAPVDPCMRTIGCAIGEDSFGSNEELWQLFVRVGLLPSTPLCKHCQQPLATEAARKKLHFSLMCWRCRQATNIIATTPLFQVSNFRKFLAALEGWCNDDKSSSIISKLRITKRTWRSYQQIFNYVVWETLRRARTTNELVLGGDGVVVEVDECHLHGRKYNRGRPLATSALWVVGVIERDNNGQRRSAFLLTRRRVANVLVPFIREHVAP